MSTGLHLTSTSSELYTVFNTGDPNVLSSDQSNHAYLFPDRVSTSVRCVLNHLPHTH